MRGLIGITITSYFLDPLFDRHDPLGFTAEGVLLCAAQWAVLFRFIDMMAIQSGEASEKPS